MSDDEINYVRAHDGLHIAYQVRGDGPLDILDHSCPQIGFGGKMGIDATRKGPGEGFHRPWPDEIKMDPKVQQMVEERWKEYGF